MWQGCAIEQIKEILFFYKENFDFDNIISPLIQVNSFVHYTKIIYYLVYFWVKKKHDIFFLIGKFTVLLRAKDLYSIPVKPDNKKYQELPDKKLCYSKLQPSDYISKNFSETLWNYFKGKHDKVSSHVKIPQDATAICAVLFSEVIRYPDMFFHNILMMHHFKTWSQFTDSHPMLEGGTWKCQQSGPKKVKYKEQINLNNYISSMLKDGENTATPFQLEVLTKKDDTSSCVTS